MVARTRNGFNAGHAYRPDIDGLRAVAVSSVLLYHAFPTLLPGGFIGVDVFFVISGYLITQLVTAELRTGSFSLRVFYQRRVRRILPPLLLILALSGAFGWFIMTPLELQVLGAAIGWSAGFLANGFFARSAGYFESTSYSSPLLHLWSLGVEEQFYLLWPLMLIAAARRRITAPVLQAVIGTSLAISIWGAWDSPVIHFYRLSCRAWELAAGGLLAVRAQPLPAGRSANLLSLAGLLLAAGGFRLIRGEMPFPGAWALIPTLAATLLIAAGPRAWINDRILGSPFCVFVGRISYSLYLWQQPFLFSGLDGPIWNFPLNVVFIAIATLGSYYLVEKPSLKLRQRLDEWWSRNRAKQGFNRSFSRETPVDLKSEDAVGGITNLA